MKNFKLLTVLFAASLVLFSCSNDDDNPAPVNEEEVITTMTAVLTPVGSGTAVTLQTRDLDGDGPNAPVVTVSGNLVAGTTYNGVMTLLNETEDPAENVTLEIQDEDEEHQFFFIAGGGLDVTTAYSDQDADGNPVGLSFTVTANTASTGTMTITLRHEPTKPNDGTLAGAGGETDIDATFDITVQ
ncbi:MAG: type 1 periplasmic binding fold superfamily protein [Flavobacteriaceae bacterium]|nr:type 1 periplasmic binding fold superfamily protein [Flavobacteriaceae bacterium]